jgi:hypothetical protein
MGVISMKLVGNGTLTPPRTARPPCASPSRTPVDAVTVGFKNTQEIDEAISNLNQALAQPGALVCFCCYLFLCCLFLPLSVFAVILSAEKDPGTGRATHTARTFQPALPSVPTKGSGQQNGCPIFIAASSRLRGASFAPAYVVSSHAYPSRLTKFAHLTYNDENRRLCP